MKTFQEFISESTYVTNNIKQRVKKAIKPLGRAESARGTTVWTINAKDFSESLKSLENEFGRFGQDATHHVYEDDNIHISISMPHEGIRICLVSAYSI